MQNIKKYFMTLALLLTAVTGAWAQSTEPTEWELTSQDGKVWTLTNMPANNVELQVEYYAESNLFLSKDALADKANIAVKNGETAVTFDDAGKSTTTVTEGNTVTVTYSGSKKVIGVKAEKKAKPAGPITVTWNPSDIVPKSLSDKSFTKDGITITAATCDFQKLTFGGGGSFTTTLGNFTKIEISADFTGNVSGTGWSNDGWQSATWTGNAASVSFSGDIWGGGMTCDGGNLTIVFTIE